MLSLVCGCAEVCQCRSLKVAYDPGKRFFEDAYRDAIHIVRVMNDSSNLSY